MQTYKGSCQCGKVTYNFTSEPITKAMQCNCSRCHRLGWLLTFGPASNFELLSGEENLTEYRFNTLKIAHLFCTTCGIEAFGRGKGPDGSDRVAINVRCLEGVDIDALEIQKVNGKDL